VAACGSQTEAAVSGGRGRGEWKRGRRRLQSSAHLLRARAKGGPVSRTHAQSVPGGRGGRQRAIRYHATAHPPLRKDGVDDMQELRERLQALRDRIAHVVARL